MPELPRKAAIGFAPCGCPTFALVLGYGTPAQDRRDIEKVLKGGRRVEIMDADDANSLPNFMACPHGRPYESADPKAEADRILKEAGHG